MKNKQKNVWAELQAYESDIFGYIKNSVGDAETARDLCQDVYLKALQNLKKLDPDRSLKNWLITVARNRVINYYHLRRRRQFETFSEETLRADMEKQAPDEAFQAALNSLPARQKRALMSRELEGHSYSEIAVDLGTSPSALTSLLKRARQNFTKNYLLYFLPDWFRKNTRGLELNDIIRFIDAFEPPENLLQKIQITAQKYFSQIREQWDELRDAFFPEKELNGILRVTGEPANRHILDLGSGTGFVAIHHLLKNARVTGIEINRPMIDLLKRIKRQFGFRKFSLIRANINRLPLAPGRFDQVYISLVLHHIPDPQRLISESALRIKPGGFLIVIDFMRHTNKELADKMRDLWLGFDIRTIEKWANSSGLTKVASRSWNTQHDISVFYSIFRKR